MGRDIQAIKIRGEDRRKYRDKVRRSLDVFARMLRERLFDENPSTVGQEIELNLVDERGMPSMRNADVLAAIADPAWATEVGQFNLELNEQICPARGEATRIAIDAPEQPLAQPDSITPEAACTSVQLHTQVSPDAFANYWNAAQAIAGVQVALAANSPFLFGR